MNNNACISCLISLVINIIILNYVLNLEKDKCSCSKDWKREIVKYTSGILIVLSVVTILLTFVNTKPNLLMILFFLAYMVVGLIHLVITCVYYIDLNQVESCNCSSNWKRPALLYPILVLAVAFFIGVINLIVFWPEISKKLDQKQLNNKKKSNKA